MASSRPARPVIELTVDQKEIQGVVRAIRAEADAKDLRRDLLRDIRNVAAPIVPEVQSAVRALPAHRLASPQLREAVAKDVKVETRLSGGRTGVRIKIPAKGPRKFKFAARKLNSPKGWRHPVFGNTNEWVEQRATSTPWFEPTVLKHADEVREAVKGALVAMVERIAARRH